MIFQTLAYENAEQLVFGKSLKPVSCGFDLNIGEGEVLPELKFAPRPGKEKSLETIKAEYRLITEDSLQRAIALGLPAIVLELEHVSQLTHFPQWGEEVTRLIKDIMTQYHERYGLRSALRITIADVRTPADGLRSGKKLQLLLDSARRGAKAGGDILSIESLGGKELFNHCVTREDLSGALFATTVLGSIDMEFLWKRLTEIAEEHSIIPGGDTACATANTAMFMAGGLLDTELSHVFATLVRAFSAPRSLVAFEQGARGPDKDCGYEGIFVKAITGCPISMEGKTSACAHSDLMGNLVAAGCDLWSNEAVEYHEMFGGSSVQVFTEILGYDCAQMNTALALGYESELRDIFIYSDKYRDPQALILAPENAFRIAEKFIVHEDPYLRGRTAGLEAAHIILEAQEDGKLFLNELERQRLQQALEVLSKLPDDPAEFLAHALKEYAEIPDFFPHNYALKSP